MQDDLYFIKLISDATGSDDPDGAMSHVFAEIAAQGCEHRFRRGHRQFDAFMREAAVAAETAAVMSTEKPRDLDLLLESAGEIRERWRLPDRAQRTLTARIAPGTYSLRLSTGRVLWHAELAPVAVLWADAHPDTPLPVAADTYQRPKAVPSLVDEALSGSLVVRVYPGFRSGILEVTLQC